MKASHPVLWIKFRNLLSLCGCNETAIVESAHMLTRQIHVYLWSTVLEVMQFARDAHMAEGWMIAQEPYLKNENLGVSCLNLRLTRVSDEERKLPEIEQ